MKAITMRIQKFSRPGAILTAAVVAIITSIVAANATQTITAPNAASISYSLASGANSAAITPATNKPVLVMGCSNLLDNQGIGYVTLLHIPSSGFRWAGLESYNGSPSTITSGANATAGTHIVYIDYAHFVDIQVATVDTIRIHYNVAGGGTATGNVTLIW